MRLQFRFKKKPRKFYKSTEFIEILNITKIYRISKNPKIVLRNINLMITRGEIVAIIGKSGQGKSTLLYAIAGLEPIDSGHIFVNGVNVWQLTSKQRTHFRHMNIGFIFQNFNLIPNLTAAENINLPLRLLQNRQKRKLRKLIKVNKNSYSMAKNRVSSLMSALGLHNLQGHTPEQISGGEQQKVAIARALVLIPDLILADEPTGNLDEETSFEVMDLLTQVSRENRQTFIYATHDIYAALFADRILSLQNGEIHELIRFDKNDDMEERYRKFSEIRGR